MKTFLLVVSLTCASVAWAQRTECVMSSSGNEERVTLDVAAQGVLVSMAGEDLGVCQQISSSEFTLTVRCGLGEEATYFGVRGRSGRVYADFGKIADLKNCRSFN